MTKNHKEIINLTKIGVTAALYVVLTFVVAPFSYGVFQFRISEMFNHLIDFNKRYIWALTIGCLVTNMTSPLGPIDMVVVVIGTLISGLLIWNINRYVPNLIGKLVISSIIPTVIGMLPVAFELHIIQHVPFWATYGISMVGEFGSCFIGAILTYFLAKRVDLKK